MRPSLWSLATTGLSGLLSTTTASPVIYKRASITDTDLSKMQFFAQYAGTAYCNSENVANQSITCDNDVCPLVTAAGATTFSTFSGILTDIEGLIAVDPTNELIVVSFRGSRSVRNWLANLIFSFVDCPLTPSCQIHAGFSAAWDEVSSAVLSGVAAAQRLHPTYSMISTGHSLGGAVATLAAAYMRAASPTVPVDLYTYGSPRVGNDAFAAFVTAQLQQQQQQQQQPSTGNGTGAGTGAEFRVTHLDDPVPRLPPLLLGYRHTSPEYWLSDGTATTTAYTTADVRVCPGPANTSCNAGTEGLDVDAHLYYFDRISGCGPGFDFREFSRLAKLSDPDLEDRLGMFAKLDRQYVAALKNGTTTA